MGKEDKKQPRIRPYNDASRIKKQERDDNDMPVDKISIPPFTTRFIDLIASQDNEDSAELYRESLRRALVRAYSQEKEEDEIMVNPNLQAPTLSGADASGITPEQIASGVYINIPRARTLWAGDHIKLIWGTNAFYTTLESNPLVSESHLVQYINCDQLADYQNGEVNVHYEVVRRAQLLGVSKPLTVNLQGNGRPRSGPRRRPVRRKGY